MTSSPRKTKVPAIPAIGRSQNEVDLALKALKESVEVGYGRRGDPLDRFVTLRELGDAGIAKVNVGRGGAAVVGPGDGGGDDPGSPIFDPGDPDFGDDDFTPPPAPTGVSVHHIAPSGLMVTWNPPDYHNHAYAELFRKPEAGRDGAGNPIAPTFNLGAMPQPNRPIGPGNVHPDFAGTGAGTIFTDADLVRLDTTADPLGDALNPTTYWYWVRFVSTAGVPGPYAPLLGASGQLSIDPALVLGQLITNVQNTSIYRQLVGQFFDTAAFNPIMQAGGVTNYIASLDDALHGQINQQLIRIIGVSDQPPGSQTLIQRIGYVTGIAEENAANLEEVNIWQAAITQAAADNSGGEQFAVFSYTRAAELPSQILLTLANPSAGSNFSAGQTINLIAPSGPLSSIAGNQTVFSVGGPNVILNIPGNSVPFGAGVAVTGVTIGAAGAGGGNDPDDFIDLIASVFHNVFVSAEPGSVIAREVAALETSIGEATVQAQQAMEIAQHADGAVEAMWSVRMREITSDGLVYAAGFGLGLETSQNEEGEFETLSTFLINANQFAVMGTGMAGGVIQSISRIGTGVEANIALGTSNHGIRASDDAEHPNTAVFAITDGNPQGQSPNPLAGIGLAGLEVEVVSVSGSTVRVKRTDNGSFSNASDLNVYKNALMPAPNIPFVIDTTRGVVGIRGKLVVDGLVRATEADFDVLTAQTAFIHQLQAEVVNANVVIGQRLIAGTPGTGALDPSSYDSISNFIIEMNNPVTSQYPLRYWKPATGQEAFKLDRLGNLFVGGNLSVGDDAVIATDGINVASIGGDGQPGQRFAMWIGPRANYGTAGEGRSEANGAFWVRDDQARAGFNTDLFLGDSGLMLPSLASDAGPGSGWSGFGGANPRASSIVQVAVSGGRINVKPTRSGGAPRILIIISGTLATQSSGGNDHKGYMFKATLTGSGGAAGYEDTSGYLIQEQVVDDFAPEVWPFTIMGVVQPTPGQYYVRLNMKTMAEAQFSIMQGWNVIAMHIA